MADYDAIVIGSGHNSLVCALCLADAGWKILVLERSSEIGGALRTQELTLPGFKHDLYATNVGRFGVSPIYQKFQAEFERTGLRFLTNPLPYATVFSGGDIARAYVDRFAMEQEVMAHSPLDIAGWRRVSALFDRLAPALLKLQNTEMPSRKMLRQIGTIAQHPADALRLLRILLESPRGFLPRYFHSPGMQGLVLPWSFHSDFGPDVPGGAIFSFITAFSAQRRGLGIAEGGAGTITAALRALIEGRGGTIKAQSEVTRITVRNGQAVAVRTHDAREISASRAIVAGVTPRNLFGGLVRTGDLPRGFRRRIGGFRYGIGTFVLHLALDSRLKWRAAENLAEFNTVHINGDAETLNQTYNESLAGLIPSRPLLIVSQTTQPDPSRAPIGKHVVRVHSRAFPAQIAGDAATQIKSHCWDEAKEAVADRLIDQLAEHAPNLKHAMLARYSVSPIDLERDNPNFVAGDCASGSQHLDQNYFCRPIIGWSQYRTPIKNLYMTGSSTWPGSGIHGTSGYLLAEQLLYSKARTAE
jgi:phytoene dehydrogenase-like protein